MGRSSELIEPALGRTSFLGQLYSGVKGDLIPSLTLFPKDVIAEATIVAPMPRTELDFKELRSTHDRAQLLDVSARLAVSVMGGLVSLSGSGKYLDRSTILEESTIIAGRAKARTVHKRLDLSNERLKSSVAVPPETLRRFNATHVVTAITYGGSKVGTFTMKHAKSDKEQDIRGDFDLSIMQRFGALAGVKGDAAVKFREQMKLNNLSIETSFAQDGDDSGARLDRTPESIIEAIRQGFPGLSSDITQVALHGVPVELTLTPIDRFDQISTELLFRELADDDLKRIMTFYDELMTLREQRTTLSAVLEHKTAPYADWFPSFVESCATRLTAVDDMVTASAGDLGRFLKSYRSQPDASATVESFLKGMVPKYDAENDIFRRDQEMFRSLLTIVKTAADHGFPLTTINEITAANAQITSPDVKRIVVVIVMPPATRQLALIDAYRSWGKEIKALQDLDDSASGKKSWYYTFYADAQRLDDLRALDGERGSLGLAVTTAISTSMPVFAKFGFVNANQVDWVCLNQEEWGIVLDEENNTRYVGELKNARPHGRGTMTYTDGTSYIGTWVHGRRDGIGRLVKNSPMQSTILEDGPYCDNIPSYEERSISMSGAHATADRFQHDVIRIKVFDGSDVVTTAICAVDRVAAPNWQAKKIAYVLGWDDSQRYRLFPAYKDAESGSGSVKRLPSEYSIVVRGSTVEQSYSTPNLTGIFWWPNVALTYGEGGRQIRHLANYNSYSNPSLDPKVATPFEPMEVHAVPE